MYIKKHILFALLCTLLCLATVTAQEHRITLENIYKQPAFRTKNIAGMLSLSDGEHYLSLSNNQLKRYSYKTGEQTAIFLDGSKLVTKAGDTLKIASYTLSADEKRILLPAETEVIYRHSSKSHFYIWNVTTETLMPLSDNGKQRIPQFSPDGKKVAFVRDNNLFIKNLEDALETQITQDGKINEIINGTTDWVYEEEFGFTTAFFWSPDGRYIAYYRFDERNVKEYQMTIYGDLYPEEHIYKYPKAGEDNSLVDIFIYDVAAKTAEKVDLGSETDQYVPRILWMPTGNQLAIYRLNRLQNHLEILLVAASDRSERKVYDEENRCYINVGNSLTFTPDGKQFLLTSEKDGYNHIYLYGIDGKLVKQLTTGKYDVDKIIGFDAKKKAVYYRAAKNTPYNREVYQVDFKGNITNVATQNGTNDASFSSGFQYYIHTWSDANHPPVFTVFDAKGKKLRVIEDNADLRQKAQECQFGEKEFFNFTTSQGYSLNGWMIKPPDYDPSKRYPALIYVYGGPGSQTALNSWQGGALWYRMLAQEGILMVSVDNRGTGFRGEEFKKMTYLQLGKYETEDQIEVAKYLVNEGFALPESVGVYGWSYGGYMATLCMTKGADYFTTGIAVAPVTTWRYYDNIYTERFMRTPQENPSGYDDNSPINHAAAMKGKFLIVHGTADDNVHAQNTIDMVTALVDANADFEMFFYPNSNHFISTGENTTYHLFHKMTMFLKENLKP
ncbi:MAG: S9 family peptidase [Bacteroidales bacterium]|nr:S9 family peptidase [Bacteroidales bacterium]